MGPSILGDQKDFSVLPVGAHLRGYNVDGKGANTIPAPLLGAVKNAKSLFYPQIIRRGDQRDGTETATDDQ